MTASGCAHCPQLQAQLEQARARIAELEAEAHALLLQLREVLKLNALQQGDIERYREQCERLQPNRPERVPPQELEQAFERVVESLGDKGAVNQAGTEEGRAASAAENADAQAQQQTDGAPPADGPRPTRPPKRRPKAAKGKRRHRHGRRRLDLTTLPVEVVHIDPEEVQTTGGEGFVLLGEEVSERIVFKPASFIRLRIVRRKWLRAQDVGNQTRAPTVAAVASAELQTTGVEAESTAAQAEGAAASAATGEDKAVLVAPLPQSVWPNVMADPSAIAHVILSKYDDVLPLHRQERISARQGFTLPRSTQCGWLKAAYRMLYRIVEAMQKEARTTAFCIATDATGAPVRQRGGCAKWHMFVLIADRDHVLFVPTPKHTSETAASLLKGFRGYLLVDAAPIYDVLYKGGDIIEVGCWFHARRYFWRALETDRERAMEALALIGELFTIDRECRDIPMPERTHERAKRAEPVLAMLDAWLDQHRAHVDPRGPLDKAIGYYDNQRAALRRFLDDGRLPLDNGISERQLRNLVLGRHNWLFFINETGLRWYATFRSLIASCALHGLNPQEYLEQVLRLAPHWPVTRMLELAPKYWAKTLAGLDARWRAVLSRPWELGDTAVKPAAAVIDCAA